MCWNVFINRHFLFQTFIYHRLFQKKAKLRVFITFGLPLLWERTFENYYVRHRDDEKVAAVSFK